MKRILQSPVTAAVVACLMFLLTMFAALCVLPLGTVPANATVALSAEDDPSWKFRNPDIDQWVSQIKSERDALAVREQQLKDWELRLTTESREIAAVTQAVTRTEEEFNRRVLLFTDQQKDNVKKQIKVISGMTPDGAAAMLNEMPDGDAARLLYALKPDVSGPILDAMSKTSGTAAKRAATLTQRIKDVLPASATNTLANAGH